MLNLENAIKVAGSEDFTSYKADPLKLYKYLQQERLSLSTYFEKLDPTEHDEDGNPTTNTDALTRHLMASNIALRGDNQLTLAQLHDQAEYLMPELVLREIQAGMNVGEKWNGTDCIAVTVPAKSATYHPLYIPDLNLATARSRREKSMGSRARAGKGGEFPVVSIREREKDIVVQDLGRTIETSYSVIRDYGWADVATYLQLVGAQLASDQLFDIYDLGITGDGTVGAATNTFSGTGLAAAGGLTYLDLIDNQLSFPAPFVMNRMLCPQQSLETVLAMAQFSDPEAWAARSFQITGTPMTPFGAKLKQITATPGGTPTGTVMVTLDSRFAVKKIARSPLSVEAEKIINRKYEQAVVTEEASFCILADGAITRIVWT